MQARDSLTGGGMLKRLMHVRECSASISQMFKGQPCGQVAKTVARLIFGVAGMESHLECACFIGSLHEVIFTTNP